MSHIILGYISKLPCDVRPYLGKQLDWDHDEVETDLSTIADEMVEWEEKLSIYLKMKPSKIQDIKDNKENPVLQR